MKLAAIASSVQGHINTWGIRVASVVLATAGIAAGMGAVYAPPSVAPEVKLSHTSLLASSRPTSLDQLYKLRDRLSEARTRQLTDTVFVASKGSFRIPPVNQHERLTLDTRIHIEESAEYHWKNAQTLATQAVRLGKHHPLTESHLGQSHGLWQAAIAQLEQIPSESFLERAATDKIAYYQNQLDEIGYRYDTMRSVFLRSIAKASCLESKRVHITVCNLELEECRRLNGDRPPASPASLIKVPIAVALMHKVADEEIALSTPIYIDRGNYTEDASDIWVGTNYPLRKVLARMINQSSNIATNQLIDYLKFDYINDVFRDRGYNAIYVGHKLAGDRILPKGLGKKGTNRITTDDLTDMMIDIYDKNTPEDDVLIHLLATQTDERMGQAALEGDELRWLGEKTGWNSKVLGTTTAAVIGGDRYIITIALDYTGSTTTMQKIMRAIADHILEHDGF